MNSRTCIEPANGAEWTIENDFREKLMTGKNATSQVHDYSPLLKRLASVSAPVAGSSAVFLLSQSLLWQ
jgi:hypothetical protein